MKLMSKKHKRRRPSSERATTPRRVPSAPTIFRFTILDWESRQEVNEASQSFASLVWERDRDVVAQIRQAKTAEEVLDLAILATGMADAAWFERVRQFGPGIVPLMTERLKASRNTTDPDAQTLMREHLIAALRWRGTVGGNAVQECFADLDEYAQGLASTVLGILHMRGAADLIWDLYQRTKENPETHFVGALWGLIDLQDARAADALFELLELEREYFEMFGFLARAGDARAVMPMAAITVSGMADEREEASIVLAAIAQRVGREKFIAALIEDEPAEQREVTERTVDELLQFPLDAIQEHFELFYRGRV